MSKIGDILTGSDSEGSSKDLFKYYAVDYICVNCNSKISFRFNKGERAPSINAGVCSYCGVNGNTKQTHKSNKSLREINLLPEGRIALLNE